ncbi:MAG: efflux RND transporter permease subunit [Alistipes sp.]|nr:efflux RND transporter permease subunit [Alistipes sp.]
MFNISRYSITHPTVVRFMLWVMLLGGIYAFYAMGKKEDSTFIIKSAVVECRYPGAMPTEVESLVVEPLEREIRTLTSVYKITSEAHFGRARILVELNPHTSPQRIPQAWDELRRKVNNVEPRLPEGVTSVSVHDGFGDVYGLYYALASDGGYTWDELRDYALNVERGLYTITGVEKVMLSGEQSPEVSIYLSPATLAAFDLRPEDIGRALKEQNMIAAIGERRAGDVVIEIVEGATFSSIADIENQLLTASDGKQYRLGDVARVVRGYHEPASLIVRVDGREAIGIAVASNPEMDVVAVGDSVQAMLNEMAQTLPAGLELITLYPENEIAREANNAFLVNLMESIAIVIVLVMVLMGWRAGMVVGSSLVFSIGATLLIMLYIGEGLNRTSLAGFIIAMGMLVDNAIVVTDGATSLMRQGFANRDALVGAATKSRMALLAATLIAIVSFLPLQLAPSSVAEIIRPLFAVVAISLIMSWVLALTQVPLMGVGLLRVPAEVVVRPRSQWFAEVLVRLLRHRWATVGVVVVIFGLSLWAIGRMPQNFFPQLSKPYFRADVILPDGYDIEATEARLGEMTAWLRGHNDVKRVSTTAGGTPPRYYLASGSYSSRPNYGNILVELHTADATAAVEEAFDSWVQDNIPDVWLRSSLFRLSPVPDATIEIGFVGADVDTLSRLTADAMRIMREDDRTRNVRNSWGNRVALWQPRYSQIKAQRLGVGRNAMVTSLEIATSGLSVATYREADVQMPILLRSTPSADGSLSSLTTMPVFSAAGNSFSIAQAAAGFDFSFAPPVVKRINSERVMKAQCDPKRGVNALALLSSLSDEVKQRVNIPNGYEMRVYGEAESREESNAALVSQLPVTLVVIFVILLILFGNYRDPIAVMLMLPLIFVGVVAGLGLTGKMFDFFSLLGLLGLVGMNVKNAVILISRIRELRDDGYAPAYAVVEAARDRFIPVVAASGTTVLGMLPLLFDSMFGSMAATIMGGLVVATLLVLVVLPVVYSLFYRIRL